MPSPFPGMNPYLEQEDVRHDFQTALLAHMANLIVTQLPANHVLRIVAHDYPRDPLGEMLSFLEIRDQRDRRVLTAIELLSHTDKHNGVERQQYLRHRDRLLSSRTHLVEIDLLRGGLRMPVGTGLGRCDYCVMVSRSEQRPRAGLWPIRLRDPLPKIPIPVREPDPDAILDLQAALHHVYDAARYVNYIYDGAPEPRLSDEDARWAESLVPRSGR